MRKIDTVVFDLGKVLLDWDPRYYYARHFGEDSEALEFFVNEVVPSRWIVEMDAGKPAARAISERQLLHPRYAELIAHWSAGWPHMLRGEIAGTAAIIRQLKTQGVSLFALTNFSTETFPIARERCPTLALFEDIVVSGEIGMIKPDPQIFRYTVQHCGLHPQTTLFVDDLAANVSAAQDQGWHAVLFRSPEWLHSDLQSLGLMPATDASLHKDE